MVTMKNLKDMLQIFQKGKKKKLINLNGFTLNFTDFLCQKFNLKKKIVLNESTYV